jgi:DNA topoisomerase-1
MEKVEPEEQRIEILVCPDPIESARIAGLHYIDEDEPGFRRKRWGRGFTYFHPGGERVEDEALRARFESLVIPPAWTEVWISVHPEGHIQATGRDEKGRKQYIYHPLWVQIRNQAKFDRMIAFGESLPAIREKVDTDLVRRKLSREKVLAIVVRLLEETLIRIGNREYARRNSSYGLTTMHTEHLDISGSRLHFTFHGKSGKDQDVELRDHRMARMVKRCQELPGQELFQYIDDEGINQRITSTDVNEYLRSITGMDFSAKDFRTWGGTVLAAVELYEAGPGETKTETNRKIVAAVKTVAEALGNTPAICRKYYIHPVILAAYEDNSLFPVMAQALVETEESLAGSSTLETAVLDLLRRSLREY